MYTTQHTRLSVKSVEPVQIIATVVDRTGSAVALAGATATYKIARKVGDDALLSKSQGNGITFSTNIATVDFLASDVEESGEQAYGDFWGQLTITLNSDTLVVLEGPITINKVVL